MSPHATAVRLCEFFFSLCGSLRQCSLRSVLIWRHCSAVDSLRRHRNVMMEWVVSADWFRHCHHVKTCSCTRSDIIIVISGIVTLYVSGTTQVWTSANLLVWPELRVGQPCFQRLCCATCFYWLRQLRQVWWSLDGESMKTLVHAFVAARVDYCNMVLAGALGSVTDKLQRMLNAAAHLVSGTHNVIGDWRSFYEPTCTGLMWQIRSGTSSLSHHRWLHDKAPMHLTDCCVAVSDTAGRQRLRSAHRRQLNALHCQCNTLGRWAFSITGPTVWNLLLVMWEKRSKTLSDSH